MMEQIAEEEEAKAVAAHNRKRNELSSQAERSEATMDDDDYDTMVSYLKISFINNIFAELRIDKYHIIF
jgi:hypothetical protein